nr:nucleoprotein [Brown dog tick phlebovirus 2]
MSDTSTPPTIPGSPTTEGGPSSPVGRPASSQEVEELSQLLERSFGSSGLDTRDSDRDSAECEGALRSPAKAERRKKGRRASRLSHVPGERPPSRGGAGRGRRSTQPGEMADGVDPARVPGQVPANPPPAPPPAGGGGAAVGGHGGNVNPQAAAAVVLPQEPPLEANPDVVLAWANDMCAAGVCRMTQPQLLRVIRILNETPVSRDDVIQQAKLMQYQGFDPIKTAAKMLELKQQKQLTSEQFRADIVTICVLFLTRGTNIPSIVKKMGEEGKTRVLALEQRYAVKKGQRPPEEITVPRVALTFYKVTIVAAHHLGDMLPISRTQMEGICPGYPPAMMTQAFAAAIPIGTPYEQTLFHAHGLFLFHFAKVINPEIRNKGDIAVKDSFMPAYRAAMAKRDLDRVAQNVALLVMVGVLVEEPNTRAIAVSPAVAAAALAFNQKFGQVSIDA